MQQTEALKPSSLPQPGQEKSPAVSGPPQPDLRIPGNLKMSEKPLALGPKGQDDAHALALDSQAAKEIFGTDAAEPALYALEMLKVGLQVKGDSPRLKYALAILREMKPRNVIEAQLMAQMLLLHDSVNRVIATTRREGLPLALWAKLLQTAKECSRAYQDGMDAISRFRSGGKQQVIVSHVSLETGAQAAIAVGGDVRGGGNNP